MRPGIRTVTTVAAGAVIICASGCTFDGINSIPLPGNGTGEGYPVVVELADAQNLVGNSPVKAGNVTVGNIDRIENDGWHARVALTLDSEAELPANVAARLAQTSVLGAQYIELAVPPDEEPIGRLVAGSVIPRERTSQYASVEEVLSALSLVLNGAGLEQLQTITDEVNLVLGGREQSLRGLIGDLGQFVAGLDGQRDDIVRAIDSMSRLGDELARQSATIDRGIVAIQPALEVLDQQQQRLTEMLTAVGRFGDMATEVLSSGKADLKDDLAQLAPVLNQLAAAGADLPEALKIALTIPFPVMTTDRGVLGDYLNLFLTLDVSPQAITGKVLPSIPGIFPLRHAVDPLVAPLTPAPAHDGSPN
ncbi:MCE family protein [Nocardia higoensis]|uniref:MCE family protein n=1 Tax=Nocardia higoensis TaxID=228599 RepID=UPI00031CB4CD|nr:MCE family protein [Nocardia higoensis]